MRYLIGVLLLLGLLGMLPAQAAPSVQELTALVNQLKSRDARLRQQASARLVALKDRRAVPLLEPLCRIPATTEVACKTLAKTGGAGVEALLKLRTDKAHWVRLNVVRGLGASTDPRAVAAIRATLKDADAELRATAIYTMLPRPHSAEKVRLLLPLVRDKAEECRLAAMYALRSSLREVAVREAFFRIANSTATRTRDAAVDILIQVNDPRLRQPLCTWLQGDDPDHAFRAAHALGQLGDPSVVPLFRTVLEKWIARLPSPGQPVSDDYPVSEIPQLLSRMTEGLAAIGDASALDLLYTLTGHVHPLVRKQATWAFLQLTDPRGPQVMVTALHDSNAEMRAMSAQIAYRFTDDPGVRKALLAACGDPDVEVRRSAVDRVVFDAPEQALTVLETALGDADDRVQAMAAIRLGGVKDRRAVERLLTMLDAADPKTHRLAILGLGHTDDARAEEALLALIQKTGEPRLQIVMALQGSMNPRVIHALLGLLPGADLELRYAIYAKFELTPTPLATAGLLQALTREKDTDLKYKLLEALEAIGDAKAVDPMLALLNDAKQPALHQQALRVLGRSRDPRALPVLLAHVRKKGGNWGAISGLGAYGGPQAFEALAPYVTATNGTIRMAALQAVGRSGDPRAVSLLITALHGANTEDRRLAAYGLLMLGKDKAHAAVEPLIIALEATKRLNERGPFIQALNTLTGQTLGTDPAQWRSWWANQVP